jgi:hypothetical protein
MLTEGLSAVSVSCSFSPNKTVAELAPPSSVTITKTYLQTNEQELL